MDMLSNIKFPCVKFVDGRVFVAELASHANIKNRWVLEAFYRSDIIQANNISPVEIAKILTAYESWWSANKLELTFGGINYDLIANDDSGQGSGSIYTSEGIGFGMLTSAMIMHIYQTQPNSGIGSDDYETASARFLDGYHYWVAAEASSEEIDNKKVWVCYQDMLLVWTRDAQGNPTENQTGSATDGDFYMTGAVYLAALAYKIAGDDSESNDLMKWAKARSIEISSRDFNDNNQSNPFSDSGSIPTLPGTGDSTCDKDISSSQDVQPDKAVLPIMYLFSKDENNMDATVWQSLVVNTLNFIDVAQEWSKENRSNYLMYWPYKAHQNGDSYIVDNAGITYDYDAGRNAENIGGYLVVSVSDTDYNKTATTVDSQLMGAVEDEISNSDSFYAGTTALGLYGLSQRQSLTSEQSDYYNTLVSQTPDNKYYNTGHWLMSALWMHMKPSITSN